MGKTTIEELIVELGGDVTNLDKSFKQAEKELDKAEKKLSKAGGRLTKNVTAPILGIGAAFGKIGDDFDKAANIIQVGTGKTGKELDNLVNSFDSVIQTVPDSVDVVAKSFTSLNALTGATGEILEELTTSVVDVSRILGEDAVDNASAFGKTLKQWKKPASDGVELMDDLFKITQDYDVGLGDLIRRLNTYGSVLQNAGFSARETAVLMGRMNAAGLDWSRISPGLNKAFRDMASRGEDMRAGFSDAIDSIKGAANQTEALDVATKIFGAEGAQRLTTAIRSNILSLDGLTQSLGDNKNLVSKTTAETRDFGDELGILKNQVYAAVSPLALDLIDTLKSLKPQFMGMVDSLKEGVTWFKNLSPEARELAVQAAVAAAAIGPLVVGLGFLVGSISTTVSAVGSFTSLLLKTGPWGIGLTTAGLLIGFIVDHLGGWDAAMEKSKQVIFDLKNKVTETWNSIKNSTGLLATSAVIAMEGIAAVANAFTSAASAASFASQGEFKKAWKALEDGGEKIKGNFASVADAVANSFSSANASVITTSNTAKTTAKRSSLSTEAAWNLYYRNLQINNEATTRKLETDWTAHNNKIIQSAEGANKDLSKGWEEYNKNKTINSNAEIKEIEKGWELFRENFEINNQAINDIEIAVKINNFDVKHVQKELMELWTVNYNDLAIRTFSNVELAFEKSIANMLKDGTSLKSALKGVWTSIKNSAIDALAEVVASSAFQSVFGGAGGASTIAAFAGTLSPLAAGGILAGGALLSGILGDNKEFEERIEKIKASVKNVTDEAARFNDVVSKKENLLGQTFLNDDLVRRYNANVLESLLGTNDALVENAKLAAPTVDFTGATSDILKTSDANLFITKSDLTGTRASQGSAESIFSTMLNTLSSAYNDFLVGDITADQLKRFKPLQAITTAYASKLGGGGAPIPQFANGAIVTAPTIGMIGEGGESEAIIPLSKLPQMMNGQGGEQTIIVNLDGQRLSKSIVRNFPSILRMQGVAA